jgi:hypothetical protein
MINLKLLGSRVSYSPSNLDGTIASSKFMFEVASVKRIAEKVFQEHPAITGMKAISNWTSNSDDNISIITTAPELIDDFNHVANGLIRSGHGQVDCHECNKIYDVSELEYQTKMLGSWGYINYQCQSGHSLLLLRDIHLMWSRNYL